MRERIKAARIEATGKRGKYAGYLKRQCPPALTDAAIFWQAAMMVCNPHKVSIYQMIGLRGDQRKFYDACLSYVEGLHSVERDNLDLDAAQLKSLGVF